MGLERAGLRCVWQVEINDFCRRVLAKHWPGVRRHDDVRTFPPTDPSEWRCDVVAGGFPCQDISHAGDRAGIDGERSGLWSEFARLVRLLRPRYVLVENVAALLDRGIGRVVGDLADCGYDAEWDCVPAALVGAPHIRSRLFVVAYPDGGPVRRGGRHSADGRPVPPQGPVRVFRGGVGGEVVFPHPDGESGPQAGPAARPVGGGRHARHDAGRVHWNGRPLPLRDVPASFVVRVADGVPERVDRLRGCGNAVVPQVAEWLGRRLIAAASAD